LRAKAIFLDATVWSGYSPGCIRYRMASSVSARTSSLEPSDWVRAALARLAKEGIHEVRIEVLARDLGVSKGSFYWHFRDRADLLEKMLGVWEDSELAWLGEKASDGGTASRWAQFVARSIDPVRLTTEVAIRSWARGDEKVGTRIAAVTRKRATLIAEVLREVGFGRSAAESWSEILSLICLGWMERVSRDAQFQLESRDLGELLSDVILAASARSSDSNR